LKDWKEWIKTVKYDPKPIKYHIVPIYYILPSSVKVRQALKEATEDYLQDSEEEK